MAAGLLHVVSNSEMEQAAAIDVANAAEMEAAQKQLSEEAIAHHIRTEFEVYRNHRTKHNLENRYLANIRAYNGEYSPDKLQKVKAFGGSEVYARITTSKCRGATSLLRDVYLGGERPWTMKATPVPQVPEDVLQSIKQLIAVETQTAQSLGQPVDPKNIAAREANLYKSAMRASKRKADEEAETAAKRIEDILVEGNFYEALREFVTDLPVFPIAILKGPEVRNVASVTWENEKLVQKIVPKMFWRRVSPFDVYFSPEAAYAHEAQVIERNRIRRNDLNQLIGLPGYNEENIRAILREYPKGYVENVESSDSERAYQEVRESHILNRGDMYDTLEFHGYLQGQMLLDYGFTEEQIPDPLMDYAVIAWVIARYAIKIHINPNPKQGHPYYCSSFEKIPGSLYGNALPEIISDLQDVANACLRSLVNNMAISSGPQVTINEERLSPTCDGDTLYPWKRWRFTSDPMGNNSEKAIDFFQPQSNAQELLMVYKSITDIADEVSAIPRYVTGDSKVGGAGSTASGLSMLMNNVAKVLQNVAASIDAEVLQPLLSDLYTMLILTDPSPYFRGDSKVMVRGVAVAVQRETERMRKLEMLNLTNNPVDLGIIGKKGRAALLRDVSDDLGMPGDHIIPDDDELDAQDEAAKAQQQQMMMQQAAQAQGNQSKAPQNSPNKGNETDNMHRTNFNQ